MEYNLNQLINGETSFDDVTRICKKIKRQLPDVNKFKYTLNRNHIFDVIILYFFDEVIKNGRALIQGPCALKSE